MRKFLFFLAFAALSVLSCSGDSDMPCITCSSSSQQSAPEYKGGSCDIEDYNPIEINGKVWMAKNWGCYTRDSKCYNNDSANCKKYGRLYDWATATEKDIFCPFGWHIPNTNEWKALINYVESINDLKSSDGWENGGNGTDKHGFSALPGGGGYTSDDIFFFLGIGDRSIWWTANEHDNSKAYGLSISFIDSYDYYDKSSLFSVRCLQDY
jgi:uncharacterized protein (TIGR02145 family)